MLPFDKVLSYKLEDVSLNFISCWLYGNHSTECRIHLTEITDDIVLTYVLFIMQYYL
jgi:hypothetical protein